MSVRLYVGNLPQSFDSKELDALFAAVGEGIRFKAVQDRETGAGREHAGGYQQLVTHAESALINPGRRRSGFHGARGRPDLHSRGQRVDRARVHPRGAGLQEFDRAGRGVRRDGSRGNGTEHGLDRA